MTVGAPDTTLARWIRPEMMLPELAAQSAEGVLEELAEGLSRAASAVSGAAAFSGFLEREGLGTTAIGDGFAIPHCRLAGISKVYLAVARHPLGVDFGALDGRLVHTFFALVAPQSGASAHLEVLGAIARFLRDPGNRRLVGRVRRSAELLALLRGESADGGEPIDG